MAFINKFTTCILILYLILQGIVLIDLPSSRKNEYIPEFPLSLQVTDDQGHIPTEYSAQKNEKQKVLSFKRINSKNFQFQEPVPYFIKATNYNVSDPIKVENDQNFTDYGFPGSGTLGDPYIISGFNITRENATLITIKDTDLHFSIQNNYLNGIQYYRSGSKVDIDLDIRNEYYMDYDHLPGIYVTNTSNAVISHNNITNLENGIMVENGSVETVSHNSISNIAMYGIWLYNSTSPQISHNEIEDALIGLMAQNRSNIEDIASNFIHDFDVSEGMNSSFTIVHGIYVYRDTTVNKIVNNFINNFDSNRVISGISVSHSSVVTSFRNNSISNLRGHGNAGIVVREAYSEDLTQNLILNLTSSGHSSSGGIVFHTSFGFNVSLNLIAEISSPQNSYGVVSQDSSLEFVTFNQINSIKGDNEAAGIIFITFEKDAEFDSIESNEISTVLSGDHASTWGIVIITPFPPFLNPEGTFAQGQSISFNSISNIPLGRAIAYEGGPGFYTEINHNRIENGDTGIYIDHLILGAEIKNNKIETSGMGIFMECNTCIDASYDISLNNITSTGLSSSLTQRGIFIRDFVRIGLISSNFIKNYNFGIHLGMFTDSIYRNNTLVANNIGLLVGLEDEFVDSSNSEIHVLFEENLFKENEIGLRIRIRDDPVDRIGSIEILKNNFENNHGYGLSINANSRKDLLVGWNNFIGNNGGSFPQAYDTTVDRSTYRYNYFDEWPKVDDDNNGIIDNPYDIGTNLPGIAESEDPFPTMLPYPGDIQFMPAPRLTFPGNGQTVSNITDIKWVQTPGYSGLNITFLLRVRLATTTNWFDLAANLTENLYSWNTLSFDNGNYEVQVITWETGGISQVSSVIILLVDNVIEIETSSSNPQNSTFTDISGSGNGEIDPRAIYTAAALISVTIIWGVNRYMRRARVLGDKEAAEYLDKARRVAEEYQEDL